MDGREYNILLKLCKKMQKVYLCKYRHVQTYNLPHYTSTRNHERKINMECIWWFPEIGVQPNHPFEWDFPL